MGSTFICRNCYDLTVVLSQPLQEPKTGVKKQTPEPTMNFLYTAKIVFVFLFMFLLMGIFTLALENLPKLILFINSST